jgi:hypothetical protein
MPESTKQPAKLFIIYARGDEDFRHELQKALTPLVKNNKIQIWSDFELIAGEVWEERIKEELKSADLIAVLVSNNYFQSRFIHEVEIKEALIRHERKETILIPIIVRPCVWDIDQTVSRLQVLPSNGIPVSNQMYWGANELAWENVARGISISLNLLKDNSNPSGRRVVLLQQQFIDDDVDVNKSGSVETSVLPDSDYQHKRITDEQIKNTAENDTDKKQYSQNQDSQNQKTINESKNNNMKLNFTSKSLIALGFLLILFLSYRYIANKDKPSPTPAFLPVAKPVNIDSLKNQMLVAISFLKQSKYENAIKLYKTLVENKFEPENDQIILFEKAVKDHYSNLTSPGGSKIYFTYPFVQGMMRIHISSTGKISYVNRFGEKMANDFDRGDDFGKDPAQKEFARVFKIKNVNRKTKKPFGNYFYIDNLGVCRFSCEIDK